MLHFNIVIHAISQQIGWNNPLKLQIAKKHQRERRNPNIINSITTVCFFKRKYSPTSPRHVQKVGVKIEKQLTGAHGKLQWQTICVAKQPRYLEKCSKDQISSWNFVNYSRLWCGLIVLEVKNGKYKMFYFLYCLCKLNSFCCIVSLITNCIAFRSILKEIILNISYNYIVIFLLCNLGSGIKHKPLKQDTHE